MGSPPEMPEPATWARHITSPVRMSNLTHQGAMDKYLACCYLAQTRRREPRHLAFLTGRDADWQTAA